MSVWSNPPQACNLRHMPGSHYFLKDKREAVTNSRRFWKRKKRISQSKHRSRQGKTRNDQCTITRVAPRSDGRDVAATRNLTIECEMAILVIALYGEEHRACAVQRCVVVLHEQVEILSQCIAQKFGSR